MASHKQSPRQSAFNAIVAMATTSETLAKPQKSFDSVSARATGAFKPLVRRITPNSVVFCHKELPAGGCSFSTDVEAGESSRGAAQSEGESSHGCNSGDGDSSGDNMEDDGDEFNVVLHEYDGEVSPLRALSQVAHMKRKQDYMDDDYDNQKWSGVASPLSLQVEDGMVHVNVQEPVNNSLEDVPSPVQELLNNCAQDGPSPRSKKLKQVQFQLEPLVYEKLMSLLVEQHDGSFERFVISAINANVVSGKSERKNTNMNKKPAFSKWKRTRFDQLKGTETQDLAFAYKSLAESTPGGEVLLELINTPWQELNMAQVQKMLEETKKMLLLNEKVYSCPHPNCGRRFSTPGNLRDHLNEHSGEQPYSCTFEDCPYRFTSKQLLCRHMKKHERAHKCTFDGCNKRFAFKERLIVHQKIHSDERPLSCPWEGCGKTFKWANSLHGHMRTHTGEKPFQCTFPGCGRLFGYKVDLTRHRRTHFGQPASSCKWPVCMIALVAFTSWCPIARQSIILLTPPKFYLQVFHSFFVTILGCWLNIASCIMYLGCLWLASVQLSFKLKKKKMFPAFSNPNYWVDHLIKQKWAPLALSNHHIHILCLRKANVFAFFLCLGLSIIYLHV